jgi:hypothetical protein
VVFPEQPSHQPVYVRRVPGMSRAITIKPGQVWVSHNPKTRTLTRRVIA